jgi:hypothetical protein
LTGTTCCQERTDYHLILLRTWNDGVVRGIIPIQLLARNRSQKLRVYVEYCPNRVELPSCHTRIYVIGGLHNFQLNTPPCCSRIFIATIKLQTDAYIAVPARKLVHFIPITSTLYPYRTFLIFVLNTLYLLMLKLMSLHGELMSNFFIISSIILLLIRQQGVHMQKFSIVLNYFTNY